MSHRYLTLVSELDESAVLHKKHQALLTSGDETLKESMYV